MNDLEDIANAQCVSDSEILLCKSKSTEKSMKNPNLNTLDDSHLNIPAVHYIDPYIVETLSSPLPSAAKDRRREQDKRKRVKEKWALKHKSWLTVESSYIVPEVGNDTLSLYHNTLFFTDNILKWQERLDTTLRENYIPEKKKIVSGTQTIWSTQSGNKFLVFSFYPSKRKIMTQGEHAELLNWLTLYKTLRANIEECHEFRATSASKSDDIENKAENKASTPSKELLMDDRYQQVCDSVCIQTQIETQAIVAPDIPQCTEGDAGVQPKLVRPLHLPFTDWSDTDDTYASAEAYFDQKSKNIITPTTRRNQRRLPSLALSARMPNPKLNSRRESIGPLMNTILDRLDSLEGVITGLQGGYTNVVNSVESYRRETEECNNGYLRKMEDLTKKINECLLSVPRSEEKCCTGRPSSSQLDQIVDKLCNELVPPINSIFKDIAVYRFH